jgi:hypothetical protein
MVRPSGGLGHKCCREEVVPLPGWRDPRAGDSWCSGIYPYVKNSQIYTCPEAYVYTDNNPWRSPDKDEDGVVSYLVS